MPMDGAQSSRKRDLNAEHFDMEIEIKLRLQLPYDLRAYLKFHKYLSATLIAFKNNTIVNKSRIRCSLVGEISIGNVRSSAMRPYQTA